MLTANCFRIQSSIGIEYVVHSNAMKYKYKHAYACAQTNSNGVQNTTEYIVIIILST